MTTWKSLPRERERGENIYTVRSPLERIDTPNSHLDWRTVTQAPPLVHYLTRGIFVPLPKGPHRVPQPYAAIADYRAGDAALAEGGDEGRERDGGRNGR